MTEHTTALTTVEPITDRDLDLLWRVAVVNANSKRFPDAQTPEQAMAKILLGRDLGLGPMQSLIGLYIVEGKPQTSAVTLGAFVRKSESDYRVLKLDDTGCILEFGPGKAPGKDEDGEWLPWPQAYGLSEFTPEDAVKAGLANKNNYKSYPRNMFFARAMSNGVKWYVPEATHGIPVYHEGEMESRTVVDGSVGAEPLPEPQASKPLNAAVLNDVPDMFRERLQGIWADAQELRPGQMTRAQVHMTFRGSNEQRMKDYLDQQEARNQAARDALPPEAEVVEGPAVVEYPYDDGKTQEERAAVMDAEQPGWRGADPGLPTGAGNGAAPTDAQIASMREAGAMGYEPSLAPEAGPVPGGEPVRPVPQGATPQIAHDGPVPGSADVPEADGLPRAIANAEALQARLTELATELESIDPTDTAMERRAAELAEEMAVVERRIEELPR